MKILIVDDMEVNLELLEARLVGSGYEVISAKNGTEALEKLKRESIDMIISDILMPKMDGFQLCRECKRDDTLRKIPFVFYTATYTDKKDEEFALGLGAESFIVKPMEHKRFMEIIEDILESHKKGLLILSGMPVEKGEPVFLKEYNERLIKKLEDKLVQLESANNTLRESKEELRKLTHDLGERVKELHCLYNISKIAEELDLSLEETTQRIANLIPPAWQYPDITSARIILRGKEFKTEDFETSVWKQTNDISVYGKRIGTVEVYYSEEKATDFEDPFLKEERDLIEAISERLGRIIERKQAEEEKKKLEAQLVQAQKMEAIGTLAGGIAHDFNNILSPIIGYTELLKMKLSEDSSSQADLAVVLKAGLRARDLVAQIMAFSRQGDQELVPVLIDPIVKEAVKLLRSSIPTTIEIRHNIAKCGTTLADATQVHQVVMNLCTNAYHAMEERRGTLEVSLLEVDIDDVSVSQLNDLKPGPYVQLKISDTGTGIDPKIMDRIFDPYFTTKDKEKGTGLGLSMVHGIVKNHGGTISVYSEPLKGTTFNVYFPLSKKLMDADKAAFEPIPTGNERILFVDDEHMLINLGKQMLQRLGYRVTAEPSSLKAFELFRKNPDKFDLVLTDITMPNLTGVQLAQNILEIRSDIPIVLCTGSSERIVEEKVKQIGIRGFLMKPLVMKHLADSVRKALDEHNS